MVEGGSGERARVSEEGAKEGNRGQKEGWMRCRRGCEVLQETAKPPEVKGL